MKTAIIYASSHGTAEECARRVKESLGEGAELINLKRERIPDLSSWDRVILGGSVHAGQLQGKLRRLMKSRSAELTTKPLGLFLCSLENSREQFDKIFPEELRSHAAALGLFGGRLDPEKLNPFFRFVMKKVKGNLDPEDTLDGGAIRAFSDSMGT